MNCNKTACVLIPNFGLNLLLQKDPTLLLEATALGENDRETAILLEVNGKAEREGIRTGMTKAQANSLCDGLNVLVRKEKWEAAETGRLHKRLQDIAPLVECDQPGVFFLEADGLQRLYGSVEHLAEKLIASIKAEQYPVSVGIAANKFAARVAARVSRRYHYTCIPDGCQREFLANLSVTNFKLDQETETRLLQLGLRTMGQLASFPTNELQERFGLTGWRISLLSRGDDPDQLLPETLAAEISVSSFLTTPLYRSTNVISQVEQLLDQLFVQLQLETRGCRGLALRLIFTDHGEKWLLLSVAHPTLSVAAFRRQLQGKLERARFPEAVEEITLTATDTAPLPTTQLELAGGVHQISTPDEVASSLRKVLTTNRLYRPRLNYSPVPEESFKLTPFDMDGDNGRAKSSMRPIKPHYSLQDISGLRLLTPAREARVTSANGQPTLLQIGNRKQRIKHLFGPWKLSGNWWSHDFNRQYYEIETVTQEQYLLYFDTMSSLWFLQGVFD